MNYFVSLETHICVEREKKSVVLEKILFQETTRVEWIEANCALKIIIFRYFAFFLELTFYFLLFNHYYLLIIFIYFCARLSQRTVRTASYAPVNKWF